MAKYFDAGISDVSFLADEDLTAYQFRLMMASSTVGYCQLLDIVAPGDTPDTVCGRMPIGVLTNSPSAGQEATVKVIGFTKARACAAGCKLTFGSLLSASNDGNFVSASDDTEDPIWGIWFGPNVANAASAVGNVLLNMSFIASGMQMLATTN